MSNEPTELTATVGLQRHPGWNVTLLVAVDDGVQIVKQLTLEPQSGSPFGIGHGITARMLRDVPLATMLHRFTLEQPGEIAGALLEAELDRTGRVGRKRRTERDYAMWAKLYLDRVATSRSPISDLARELGYSPHTVRDLIYKAREKGMLTGTVPGRAGGHLSVRAKQLLAEARES